MAPPPSAPRGTGTGCRAADCPGSLLRNAGPAARQIGGEAACRRSRPCASSSAMRSSRIARTNGPGSRARVSIADTKWSCRLRPTPGAAPCTAMPCAAQRVRIADARQHQELRRVDRAAGEDAPRARRGDALRSGPAGRYSTPTARPCSSRTPGHQRVRLDGEIRAAPEPGADRRPRRCSGGRRRIVDLQVAEAFLLARRCSRRCAGWPAALSRLQPGIDQRVRIARAARRERAVAAAIAVGAALPALLPAEIGQHVRVGPAVRPLAAQRS